ncbi:MAG: hypothetical protein ABIG96_00975 [Candidatus Micrarchaeota archaeon]
MPTAMREREVESVRRDKGAVRRRRGGFARLLKRGVRDFLSPEDSAEILRERFTYEAPQKIPRSLLAIRAWSAGRNITIMRRMLKEMEHPENRRMLREGINPYFPGARQVEATPAFAGRMVSRIPIPPLLREALARRAEEGTRGAMKTSWRLLEIVRNNLNTYPGMMMGLGGMGYVFGKGMGTDPWAMAMAAASAAGGSRLLTRGQDELGHRWRTVRPSKFYIREQVERLADYVNLNETKGRRLVEEFPGMLRRSISEHEQRRSAILGAMQNSRFGRLQLNAAGRMRGAAGMGRERFSIATRYMLRQLVRGRRK